jgi:hypothetical protein
MNIGLDLIEIRTPCEFFLQHDGRMVLASDSNTINNIIYPENEEEWMMMRKTLISLLRQNKAMLSSEYLLTPNDKFVLNNEKTRKTIQKGGYLIYDDNNISKPAKRKRRRKSNYEERATKRQKLIKDNKRKWEAEVEVQRKKRKIEEILERVNAEYRLRIETDFGDYSQYHMVTGLLRNVPKLLESWMSSKTIGSSWPT